RIQAMLALFESRQCLSQRLASYFGDRQAPPHCGHCSVCLGQAALLPAPPPLRPLAELDGDALCATFVQRHEDARGHRPGSECLTGFVCGISAPLFVKLKARQISGFAALADYPYAEVRAWLTGL